MPDENWVGKEKEKRGDVRNRWRMGSAFSMSGELLKVSATNMSLKSDFAKRMACLMALADVKGGQFQKRVYEFFERVVPMAMSVDDMSPSMRREFLEALKADLGRSDNGKDKDKGYSMT